MSFTSIVIGIIGIFVILPIITIVLPYLYSKWIKLSNIIRYMIFLPVAVIIGFSGATLLVVLLFRDVLDGNAALLEHLIIWASTILKVGITCFLVVLLLPRYERLISYVLLGLLIASNLALFAVSIYYGIKPEKPFLEIGVGIISIISCVICWFAIDKMLLWKREIANKYERS